MCVIDHLMTKYNEGEASSIGETCSHFSRRQRKIEQHLEVRILVAMIYCCNGSTFETSLDRGIENMTMMGV